jgi:hypothetical protein
MLASTKMVVKQRDAVGSLLELEVPLLGASILTKLPLVTPYPAWLRQPLDF